MARRKSNGQFAKKSSGHHKSWSHHSTSSAPRPSRPSSAPKSGRRRRGKKPMSTGVVVGIAAGASVAGLLAAYLLDDHLPDAVHAHRYITSAGVGVVGTIGAGVLAYLGHPVVGAAVGSFAAGVGAFEGLSGLAASKDDNAQKTAPAVGPNNPGGIMPAIGPTSAAPLLSAGQDAVNQAIGVLAPWLTPRGPTDPTAPQPGQVGPIPGIPGLSTDPNGNVIGPNIPYLPSGYQDPIGAAIGIGNTLLGSAAPAQGAPTNGAYVPTPWGPLPINKYGLPGDVLPPDQWPSINRVVPAIGCAAPIRRVIATPFG